MSEFPPPPLPWDGKERRSGKQRRTEESFLEETVLSKALRVGCGLMTLILMVIVTIAIVLFAVSVGRKLTPELGSLQTTSLVLERENHD